MGSCSLQAGFDPGQMKAIEGGYMVLNSPCFQAFFHYFLSCRNSLLKAFPTFPTLHLATRAIPSVISRSNGNLPPDESLWTEPFLAAITSPSKEDVGHFITCLTYLPVRTHVLPNTALNVGATSSPCDASARLLPRCTC